MKIRVLDHGYVEFIEAWGHGKSGDCEEYETPEFERGIVEAARQSTQGSFRGWGPAPCDCDAAAHHIGGHIPSCASKQSPGDAKLLAFLHNNHHATPFEFAGLVIEVQAPIFVLREWHRHRTQSYNEMSARYTPLPDMYYVPTVARLMMDGGTNKQANSTGAEINEVVAESFVTGLRDQYQACENEYQDALAQGVPKELARLVMPVGHYSRMRASANLRNWLGFLTLRLDSKAQWEIRQYAEAIGQLVAQHFPRTWELFKS